MDSSSNTHSGKHLAKLRLDRRIDQMLVRTAEAVAESQLNDPFFRRLLNDACKFRFLEPSGGMLPASLCEIEPLCEATPVNLEHNDGGARFVMAQYVVDILKSFSADIVHQDRKTPLLAEGAIPSPLTQGERMALVDVPDAMRLVVRIRLLDNATDSETKYEIEIPGPPIAFREYFPEIILEARDNVTVTDGEVAIMLRDASKRVVFKGNPDASMSKIFGPVACLVFDLRVDEWAALVEIQAGGDEGELPKTGFTRRFVSGKWTTVNLPVDTSQDGVWRTGLALRVYTDTDVEVRIRNAYIIPCIDGVVVRESD